jgi:hypothetical protein
MNNLQEFTKLLKEIATKNKLYESTTVLSESQEFIYAHRDELNKQYPHQWIAVHRTDIVGHHKDLLSLVRKLRKSGVPLQNIALEMPGSEEIPLALQFIL